MTQEARPGYRSQPRTPLASAYVRLSAMPPRTEVMAMPAPVTQWTLEMVHALPDDGNRYELIDGELLVSPSPTIGHQRVLGRLYVQLDAYVRRIGDMEALFAPAAITFSVRRELQPDLFVLPVPESGKARTFADVGRLVLAVEVLSPSTARYDRVTKRRVFQEEGVPEYWVVDPDARTVERWRARDERPEILIETLTWQPLPEREALSIDLSELFRAALE